MRHPRHPHLLLALVAFLGALISSCIGTETGNPAAPDYTHRVEPTAIETVANQVGPATPAPPELVIEGGSGSVQPATGTIYAWPLENNLPAATAAIESDGRFVLNVSALPGDLVRLQVRAGGGGLSPPLDIIVFESGMGFTRFNPALPCLRSAPEVVLQIDAEAGAEDAITITNHCDESVSRSAARIREATDGVTLTDEGPLVLAPGEQSTIRVRIEDPSTEPATVLYSLMAPVQEIRAVTVGVD